MLTETSAVNSAIRLIIIGQKCAKLKGVIKVEVAENQNDSVSIEPNAQGKLAIAGIVRPVSTSSLQVVETYNVMGIRPISANTFQTVYSMNLSGIRPVESSSLVLSSSYSVLGNRPVASNVIDDSDSLMGFLD